jgi:hypothetical protein
MTDSEREVWAETAEFYPGARRSDRIAFSVLVRLAARMRTDPDGFSPAAFAVYRAYLRDFKPAQARPPVADAIDAQFFGGDPT